MSARNQREFGLAAFASVALAAALILPGCGGGGGGGCGENPTGPSCGPSPSPTPPPAVTRVISQGSGSLGRRTVGPVVFTTTATGSVGITVDWTFATNDVDIFVARGADPCTLETFNNRTCGFVASEESPSMKPEKLTVPGVAPGTYTLYVGNYGETDESVAYQVTLTSASGTSVSWAGATVTRSAAKGTMGRLLPPG